MNIKELLNKNEYSCSGMQIILRMIESGIYHLGTNHKLNYYDELRDASISNYPESKLTDAVCEFLISYGKCKFSEVPEKARTRDFYLNTFTDKDVFKYIETHINEFDKKFFKDLLATNHYSLVFSNNAFEIMPLEYIDNEMVDIAFLNATNWTDDDWFQSVVRRKPEAITYQAWLCAARYYSSVYNLLNDVPDFYKTEIFYLELMSCCYNCGMSLTQDKEKTIQHLDDNVFTPNFLLKLICLDIENIGRIPEKYMETIVDIEGKKNPIWKVGILVEPKTITMIQPTWERIQLFKDRYGENSFYYNLYCKDIEEKLEDE